jgi:hypothetical protein
MNEPSNDRTTALVGLSGFRKRCADASAKENLLDGYLALAKWSKSQLPACTPNSIRSFRVTWPVPQPPETNTSVAILLFIGMETAASETVRVILQPVLQWELLQKENEYCWSVANYLVYGRPQDPRVLAMTAPSRVEPRDVLTAAISLEEKANGIFQYKSEFVGISGSELHVASPNELVQTGVALEVSQMMQLSDLPLSHSLQAFRSSWTMSRM